MLKKITAAWTAAMLIVASTPTPALPQGADSISGGTPIEWIFGGVVWLVWQTGRGVAYVYDQAGNLIRSVHPYSVEEVTKEECWNTPGAIGWKEYTNQARTPRRERLGTCYVED